MSNLLLPRLFQNEFITNRFWILLQFAEKSGENRVRIQKVSCTYLFFWSDEGQTKDSQLSLFLVSKGVSITVTLVMWVSLVMLVRRPLGVMTRVDDPWSPNLSPPLSHPTTQRVTLVTIATSVTLVSLVMLVLLMETMMLVTSAGRKYC